MASLTLVKSAYRLGETVNGSVLINSGEGRVLRVRDRFVFCDFCQMLITHRFLGTGLGASGNARAG